MNTNIKQHDITDCAAACIASVARHYGSDIPLTAVREASGTSVTGTTLKGVVDACTSLGFKAGAYKSDGKDVDALRAIPYPVILHVVTASGDLHFVVLYRCGRRKAVLMDPAAGARVRVPYPELKEMWTGYLVTMTPDGTFRRTPEGGRTSLASLSGMLSRKEYAAMCLSSATYVVAGICTALFLQHIIDDVIPGRDPQELLRTASVMAALMVLTVIVGYERILFSLRVNIKMDSRLTLGYLDHLFRLPAAFFTRRGAGELHSRLDDASKIRSFLTEGLVSIATGALLLLASFALMFTYNRHLALLMMAFIPVYLTIYLVAGKVNRRMNRSIMESSAAFEEKAVEGMSSIRLVKHFGGEGAVFNAISRRYTELAGRLFRSGKYMGAFASSADAVSKLMTAVLLSVGALFIFRGSLSVGELVSFYSLSAYFSAPLGRIAEVSDQLTEARISAERLGDILDLKTEEPEGFSLPAEQDADIVFDHISFSYAGCPVLFDDLSLTIPHGKITAIRGESGCGKSSVAALLMRDFRVSKGKIMLGSTDISLIPLDEWRRRVSIIPQEPELLNCSILDNITCMEKSPDVRKVTAILDELGLHDFVTSLPLGILTPAGNRGCTLSGGQKQRIALARALYRDPQILILDEATSSLDDISQEFVLKKISSLRDLGKTIVMITHKHDNAVIADNTIRL